jgi:hypothetical protein
MINAAVETSAVKGIHQNTIQSVQNKLPDQIALYQLADLFKLFGDSTRISILWALSESEMCVTAGRISSVEKPETIPGGQSQKGGKNCLLQPER